MKKKRREYYKIFMLIFLNSFLLFNIFEKIQNYQYWLEEKY